MSWSAAFVKEGRCSSYHCKRTLPSGFAFHSLVHSLSVCKTERTKHLGRNIPVASDRDMQSPELGAFLMQARPLQQRLQPLRLPPTGSRRTRRSF